VTAPPPPAFADPFLVAGDVCPDCGGKLYGPSSGVHGGESVLTFVLLAGAFIPALLYYASVTRWPYCANERKRLIPPDAVRWDQITAVLGIMAALGVVAVLASAGGG
jgi:hypothetical protein